MSSLFVDLAFFERPAVRECAVDMSDPHSKPVRERALRVVVVALLVAGAIWMLRKGLSEPATATVTGSSEILGCEEHVMSRRPVEVVVHVATVPDGLTFVQPDSYLRYVREACAAHAVVSWGAVLGRNSRSYLVAFERPGVPGGFTEETYAVWWRGMRVLWITFGVGALWVAFAIAVTTIQGRRTTPTRPPS